MIEVVYLHGGGAVPPEIEELREWDDRDGSDGEGLDHSGTDADASHERTTGDASFTVTAVTVEEFAFEPLPGNVDCVVVDHDPPAFDGLAAAAWLEGRYPGTGVVLLPTVESTALASAAVNANVDGYVRPTEGAASAVLAAQIRRVAADKTRHVETGENEDAMLESLLTTLPRWVSIYFKDRLGRHVAVSGPEESFSEEYVIHTPDGQVVHSREDVLGKTDFDLYDPELAKQTRRTEQQIMRTTEPVIDLTEENPEPDGSQAYYATTKAPWYDQDGNVLGIVGITVEITERVQRRQDVERERDRLDRFASVLSHDVRNPLNVAQGNLGLIEAAVDLPPEAADALVAVDRSLDRIEAIVDDTLELARQGTVVEDPDPVDLAATATEAWSFVDAEETTLHCAADLPVVLADPDRLQRLLENLFRNALEHAPAAGSPPDDLTVTVGRLDDGFYVADDGDGIPEDEREAVFERSYSTSEDGTGFGLAVVREIATAHDWSVTATESDDGGAQFEFRGVNVRDVEP